MREPPHLLFFARLARNEDSDAARIDARLNIAGAVTNHVDGNPCQVDTLLLERREHHTEPGLDAVTRTDEVLVELILWVLGCILGRDVRAHEEAVEERVVGAEHVNHVLAYFARTLFSEEGEFLDGDPGLVRNHVEARLRKTVQQPDSFSNPRQEPHLLAPRVRVPDEEVLGRVVNQCSVPVNADKCLHRELARTTNNKFSGGFPESNKRRKSQQLLMDVDEELLRIGKQLQLFVLCEPTNALREREAFLKGKTQPQFHYPPLPFTPRVLRAQLQALCFSGPFAPLYVQAREALLLQLDILEHRGTARVREASRALYGCPDEETLKAARELLSTPHVDTPKTVPAAKVREALEAALQNYGLTDWIVQYTEKHATTVDAMNRRITLNKDRLFAAQDLRRLPIHEVGVHVLRAENGRAQPAMLFLTGLPGYLATEEGLAAYAEEHTNTALPESRRSMAGHVLAVDALHRGLSFRETFTLLAQYFPQGEAWRLTLRNYRAGGLAKDHAYLQGLLRVKQFLKAGGDLRTLYVGKVGIEHLPLLPDTLAPPRYLPRWL
ncbi:DUF1704 domain-containing protein [Candidatus Woesearchaeota archaeon]|nr:MAG: DUF1704 domain-containing protein [Candidatus Woesearchaeota archaeon]